MLDIKQEIKDKIYAEAVTRFKLFYDKRECYDKRMYDWVRLYNSIPEKTRNGMTIQAWEHNTFVPYRVAHVETTDPRITAS